MRSKQVMLTLLFLLLFGPLEAACLESLAVKAMTASEQEHLAGRPVAGYAHGAKWSCGGRFNQRGKYLGPYCFEVPVSTRGAYWLNGRYYMPALTRSHAPKGWWIRLGYGGSWRNSIVRWAQ